MVANAMRAILIVFTLLGLAAMFAGIIGDDGLLAILGASVMMTAGCGVIITAPEQAE